MVKSPFSKPVLTGFSGLAPEPTFQPPGNPSQTDPPWPPYDGQAPQFPPPGRCGGPFYKVDHPHDRWPAGRRIGKHQGPVPRIRGEPVSPGRRPPLPAEVGVFNEPPTEMDQPRSLRDIRSFERHQHPRFCRWRQRPHLDDRR